MLGDEAAASQAQITQGQVFNFKEQRAPVRLNAGNCIVASDGGQAVVCTRLVREQVLRSPVEVLKPCHKLSLLPLQFAQVGVSKAGQCILQRLLLHVTDDLPFESAMLTAHSTAGHGGFKLSAERNRKVHPMLRSPGGWYEEDAEWAIVALTFPHLFTAFERRHADRTIKDSWPDAWEAITGNILAVGESRTKDQRAFEAEHATDWIVISAITSDQEKGFVEVVATPGGRRGEGAEERRFLVPATEYDIGRFGFVINPGRHAVYDGPSSFIGWQRRAS